MSRPKFRSPGAGRYGKRHVPGRMNKTEEKFAEQLEIQRERGQVLAWWFEPVTFTLAPSCRYTPDFLVMLCDQSIEFVDTKNAGPLDSAGQVKLKLAGELFWPFKFVQMRRRAAKFGGGWERREF